MIFRFDRYCLDTELLELRRDDVPMAIEPQVFDLLRLLLENRDRMVTKDEIIDAVWDGRIVSEATLSSRISVVRQAIGDDGKRQEAIRTMPRRGYRFIKPVAVEGKPRADSAHESAEGPSLSDAFERPAPLALPDKPSIAVLPFRNLNNDPDQEYIADGFAEDIITALSRFSWFFVIARNSSFTYKGDAVYVQQAARELGVQYVLAGGVRRAGDRLRVTAQLIDALTGHQIWADRFDRDVTDVFSIQDEITGAITGAVAPSFAAAEARRIERKAPENFHSWDYAIRGNWHLWHLDRENLAKAREQFEAAIELDANNALALSGLTLAISWEVVWGWADDPHAREQQADEIARRAVAADEHDAWTHAVQSTVHLHRRRLDAAERAARRALDLNPNLAFAELALASALAWAGDYDGVMVHADRAQRLSPRDPAHGWFTLQRAVVCFVSGRYEEQVAWATKMTEAAPSHPAGWRFLAAGYGLLGREPEAIEAGRGLLRVVPHFTIDLAKSSTTGVQEKDLERLLDGLRKAGIPE